MAEQLIGEKQVIRVELSISKAAEADLPGVLALYAQPEIDDGKTLPLQAALAIFRRFKDYPDYKLYVAREGNAVVGTFALLILDNLGHMGACSALVEHVAVAPERQGSGIGRRMMAFALERARERGCYKMALSSNLKRPAAHAFYDALGFERHGYSFKVELAPDSADGADLSGCAPVPGSSLAQAQSPPRQGRGG